MAALLLAALASCSKEAASIAFSSDRYVIYTETSDTLVPTVKIRPKNANYTLTSGNLALLRILDDGRSVQALKPECVVEIEAVSGKNTAKAIVIVYKNEEVPEIKPAKDTYTVIFDTGGNSSVPAQEVSPGATAAYPASPEYLGMVVGAWYKDAEFTEEYDFSSQVVSDLTLYGKWVTPDAAEFKFTTVGGKIYIAGLKYPTLTYENAVIPSADINGIAVEGIAANAFYVKNSAGVYNPAKIKRVTIPASVKFIGKEAFAKNELLEEVTFDGESGLLQIGDSAFLGCKKLAPFALPANLETIGLYCFQDAAKFSVQKLPSKITVIPREAFEGTFVNSFDFTGITTINYRAFYNSKLSAVVGTEGLTRVENEAFAYTPLWVSARSASTDSLYYIGKILIGAKTSPISASVRADTKVVAVSAFSSVTGYVRFNQETMPYFPTSGAFPLTSKPLYVVVPENKLSDYQAISGGAYKSIICYEKNLNGLSVFINPASVNQTSNANVVLREYAPSAVPSAFDADSVLYAEFGSNVIYKSVMRLCFSGTKLNGLVNVVLPASIRAYETNSFNNIPSFASITLTEAHYPAYISTTSFESDAPGSAFTTLPAAYKIFVSADKLSAYKIAWASYASRIYAAG
jgi:Listeria-Bacteroides repeat domain (List_Bact_rpt).